MIPLSINTNNPLTWIQQGKSVSIEENTGKLKLNGCKEKLCRWFIPNYAEKQDIAIARYLIKELDKVPAGANSNQVSALKDAQMFKAAANFMRKKLQSYKAKSGEIAVSKEKLQYFLNVDKLSKKLKVPFEVLKENPAFVSFALANHLHHRIEGSYQERGLGVKVVNGKIFLMKRTFDPVSKNWTKNAEPMDWQKLPVDSKGKIDGWELMAYGWQPHDNKKTTVFEPVKILTLKGNEKPEYAIELVTAKPTYKLNNLGLGMFGHSWLRIYEPIRDQSGQITNQVAVYSIGYNLEDLVTPDIFEFLDREVVTTKHVLTSKEFLKSKKDIEALLESMNGENLEAPNLPRAAFQHWFQSNCITCGTFASQLFQELTGVHIDGRLLLMKALIPNSWRYRFRELTKKAPSFLQGILNKISLLTHGYFPSVMIQNQAKIAKAQDLRPTIV